MSETHTRQPRALWGLGRGRGAQWQQFLIFLGCPSITFEDTQGTGYLKKASNTFFSKTSVFLECELKPNLSSTARILYISQVQPWYKMYKSLPRDLDKTQTPVLSIHILLILHLQSDSGLLETTGPEQTQRDKCTWTLAHVSRSADPFRTQHCLCSTEAAQGTGRLLPVHEV